ncbi:hypothetical protein BJX63DRAFT_217915 [Aspergillus granulosus]|uniref:Uncharacterized protein n=1 Tax=Aspergillus granulosus TaxID=176169 RepID=A0ABR4I1I9_9EURO
MQSSQTKSLSGSQPKKAMSGSKGASKSQQDPTAGWTIEEMLETRMDENGNPVPDAISFIDGARMCKGERGFKDEADEVAAALDDFD